MPLNSQHVRCSKKITLRKSYFDFITYYLALYFRKAPFSSCPFNQVWGYVREAHKTAFSIIDPKIGFLRHFYIAITIGKSTKNEICSIILNGGFYWYKLNASELHFARSFQGHPTWPYLACPNMPNMAKYVKYAYFGAYFDMIDNKNKGKLCKIRAANTIGGSAWWRSSAQP